MTRLWILFRTELKAWRREPLSILGGFIPPLVMLVAFGVLFGSNLGFSIAVINYDEGSSGALLAETIREVLSPFGTPYYDVLLLSESEAWQQLDECRIEGVWVIPSDFSERLAVGQNPSLEMHFTNYNDDRAKNHRLYSAEILWRFYEKIGQPQPPLSLAETYPRPEMVDWFGVIAVGLVLFGVTLGAMFNIFLLTYKEQVAHITLELGLAPFSLLWALIPKVLLALVMGLVTGAGLLLVIYLWVGVWAGGYVWTACLLAALVAPLWIALALLLGLRAKNFMTGAVAAILSGVIVFFAAGGLSSPEYYPPLLKAIAAVFPNTYAVDPLRDLILFQTWPADYLSAVGIVTLFATAGLSLGLALTCRQLRRIG